MSVNPSSLGGGPYQGHSPKQTITNYKDSNQIMIRGVLRRAWNNTNVNNSLNGNDRIITPFRAVNNLGDYLSRQNYVCGGSNQVNASRPGWKGHIGSILSACDNTGIAASVTNNRFVPDASDYITYKKQRAISQNYNDLGFGGDQNNASYVNLMAVRRS
jgi:hypothetical protein